VVGPVAGRDSGASEFTSLAIPRPLPHAFLCSLYRWDGTSIPVCLFFSAFPSLYLHLHLQLQVK
jgi:hypothetical protein